MLDGVLTPSYPHVTKTFRISAQLIQLSATVVICVELETNATL